MDRQPWDKRRLIRGKVNWSWETRAKYDSINGHAQLMWTSGAYELPDQLIIVKQLIIERKNIEWENPSRYSSSTVSKAGNRRITYRHFLKNWLDISSFIYGLLKSIDDLRSRITDWAFRALCYGAELFITNGCIQVDHHEYLNIILSTINRIFKIYAYKVVLLPFGYHIQGYFTIVNLSLQIRNDRKLHVLIIFMKFSLI